MKNIVLLFFCIFGSCIAVLAQSENVFTWDNGRVVPNPNHQFLMDETTYERDIKVPEDWKTYVYGKDILMSPNGKYTYEIQRIGLNEEPTGLMYEAVRILLDGRTILTRWGADPFWTIKYLTMQKNDQRTFLFIPLDDESFALIFEGWFFQTEIEAAKMLIVVVHKDQATVVYEAPAIAFKYETTPTFSIEYTETVKQVLNKEGYIDDYAADTKSTNWKHKIWKEGNILKYKSWK